MELVPIWDVACGELPVGDERATNVKRQSEIKKWFRDQYKVLDEKFTPFLKLKH